MVLAALPDTKSLLGVTKVGGARVGAAAGRRSCSLSRVCLQRAGWCWCLNRRFGIGLREQYTKAFKVVFFMQIWEKKSTRHCSDRIILLNMIQRKFSCCWNPISGSQHHHGDEGDKPNDSVNDAKLCYCTWQRYKTNPQAFGYVYAWLILGTLHDLN